MKLMAVIVLFSFVIPEEIYSSPIAVTTENSIIKINATNDEENEVTSDMDDELVSMFQVLFVEVKDDDLQKCIENNDTDAFGKAKAANEELSTCAFPDIDSLIEITLNNESNVIDLFRKFSKHFCKTYPTIQGKCLKNYHNSIQPCLSDTEMKGMIMYDEILHTAGEYLCKYDADFLIEAISNDFGCCRVKLFIDVAFCTLPSFQELARYDNSPLTIPRSLAGKGCQLYKDMAQCINMKLSSCKNTTYSEVIIGFFNATASTLPQCPSTRTEWEEHLDQVLGNLLREEQRQTDLLKMVNHQLDQVYAFNAKQVNIFEEDKQERMKGNEEIHSIFNMLSQIKKSLSIKENEVV